MFVLCSKTALYNVTDSPTNKLPSHLCLPQKQQAGSGVDRQAGVGGTQQALTVMVQGQGQTTGQLQVIPHGVTVIPGPGQQLMQAALPNGQVQRFLFTPLASAATPTSSTGMRRNQHESELCILGQISFYPSYLSSICTFCI